MASNKRVSVQDVSSVKGRLQKVADLVNTLPLEKELRETTGANNSMAVISFRMDLEMRAGGLASITMALRERTLANIKEVENILDQLLKTDAENELAAKRLADAVDGHGGAAGLHTHRAMQNRSIKRVGG